MEYEFDKEMDAILRRAGRSGEAAVSAGAHLDADEISAFADNAVSAAARLRFTAHLADCARCRRILSNTVSLNSEAETVSASSAVAASAVAAKAPWYRRLFAFPQLAYTMGAMVLLFSGFFAYLILQNLRGSDRAVSYSTNTAAPAERTAPPAAPAETFESSQANSNSVSNVATATNSTAVNRTSTTNSAPVLSSNTTTTAATPAAVKEADQQRLDEPAVAMTQPTSVPEAKPQVQLKRAEDQETLAKNNPAAPTAGAVAQRQANEEKKKSDDADSSRLKDELKLSEREDLQSKSAPKTARKQESAAGETRSLGGKTFNNVGGIWFDTAVGKQKPKTVRRGTSDYQKLDIGLRSIADKFDGTVVILWNGKAYRIQ